VFVDERQSNSAAAGPSNQGAAMVMGHSVKQWDKWYDMDFHPRLAQNAVDGMQSWRAAMLQSPTPIFGMLVQFRSVCDQSRGLRLSIMKVMVM
jgi:hypothetical protein